MIDYAEHFRFRNDVAKFDIRAFTKEPPSRYGNGTLLAFDVLAEPKEYGQNRLFDTRYAGVTTREEMGALARRIIKESYGVRV